MSNIRTTSKKSAALKVILSSISDAYYEIDRDGKLVFFNQVLCAFLGKPEKELLGTPLQDSMPPDAADLFVKLLEQTDSKVVPVGFEWECVGPGRRTVLEASISLIRDSKNRHAGFRGIIRDITTRREAHEEREAFQRRMLQTQKLESLGILAGGVAHQFNNMLMGILGYAELVREDLEEGSEAHSLMGELEDIARRAADLTAQMLAYSGRGTVAVESLDLSRVVKEIESLLRSTLGSGVSLRVELGDGLDPTRGDAVQIRQILVNLVTNASEALPNGGKVLVSTGTIRLDKTDLDAMTGGSEVQEGNYVYLEVRDNGCGLGGSDPERIFEPFYTTKFTGRGLGLPTVQGIVRSHGGAVWVRSGKEVGTVATVYLPVVAAELEREEVPQEVETRPSLSGFVMVVDDEEIVLNVTRFSLKKMGYEVITFDNGIDAVEEYRRSWKNISVIVLDLTMPEMSGEDVFKAMVEVNPDVQVVLTSGFTEHEVGKIFTEQNLVKFLQKPYRPIELQEVVQAVIGAAAETQVQLDL